MQTYLKGNCIPRSFFWSNIVYVLFTSVDFNWLLLFLLINYRIGSLFHRKTCEFRKNWGNCQKGFHRWQHKLPPASDPVFFLLRRRNTSLHDYLFEYARWFIQNIQSVNLYVPRTILKLREIGYAQIWIRHGF